ncbi:hypothetical protein cypCar_00042322 [Cyprinus carpio]|nr:hypothetical protein cypCar_00042322 [Cyprinus carpio]
MRSFKSNKDAGKLMNIFKELDEFTYESQANMGGTPKPKVEQIKRLVTENDPNREKNLGKHEILSIVVVVVNPLYLVPYTDESTSVGLCGIVWEGLENKRRAFPWLAQINIARAAHCFKEGDTHDKITVQLENWPVKVKKYVIHPYYNLTAKQQMGIQEYYEFDVALIQLEKPVDFSSTLRPICIPCTKETNGALKLSESEGTCRKHEEILMSNELVKAAFTSYMETDHSPKHIKNIIFKLGKYRDACVEDAKKAKGINVENAREAVTDNFLCSGGIEPETDDVACKGEDGGASYVNKKGRVIQGEIKD